LICSCGAAGFGYAVTSHSSQGATADRELVHVDTEHAREELINSRLAYVSISRGRYDAQIYTYDAEKLGEELSGDISKQSAMKTGHEIGGHDQGRTTENAAHESVSESHEHGEGYGIGH
jgi:ATP-dependent exoDNAse (exonuclease V) alpha subunit